MIIDQEFLNTAIDELKKLLEFKSISSSSVYKKDCIACAVFLKDFFTKINLKSKLLETNSNPVVFAEHNVLDAKETILVYGHYDVQGITHLDSWNTDPFKPEIKGHRIYARGARDNKGQFFSIIKAVEKLIKLKKLKYNVKFLIEGDEETGKVVYQNKLKKWSSFLRSDFLLASELPGLGDGKPAITLGLRGCIIINIEFKTAKRSLHSGHNGNLVPNSAIELNKFINTLFDENYLIKIKDFYEDVVKENDFEKNCSKNFFFDANKYLKNNALKTLMVLKETNPIDRVWFMPSMDLVLQEAGNVTGGVTTIIPHIAKASLVIRTVPNQINEKIVELFKEHCKKNIPSFVDYKINTATSSFGPVRANINDSIYKKIAKIISPYMDNLSPFIYSGASLPVIPMLIEVTKAKPVLMGFGMDNDFEHSSNESYSIKQFEKSLSFFTNLLSN